MKSNAKGSTGLAVITVMFAIGLAISNLLVFASSSDPTAGEAWDVGPLLFAHYEHCPGCVIYFGLSPLFLGTLAALVAARRSKPAAAAASTAVEAKVAVRPEASALQLLRLMQSEARFVDFIREDVDGYSDEQIGAAARAIHAGCRKALRGRIELEKILPQDEGSKVEIAKGFDPATIRLIGNVTGEPPFRGTLEHAGWRASMVQLPESPGDLDPTIIAPAEVEIA